MKRSGFHSKNLGCNSLPSWKLWIKKDMVYVIGNINIIGICKLSPRERRKTRKQARYHKYKKRFESDGKEDWQLCRNQRKKRKVLLKKKMKQFAKQREF